MSRSLFLLSILTTLKEEIEDRIQEAIVHVLEILPDQDPEFLRRCLEHPNYRSEDGKDKLIASLLDGSIPIELMDTTESSAQPTNVDASMQAVERRRNVFDDQVVDFSSLRIGKKRYVVSAAAGPGRAKADICAEMMRTR